MADFGRGNPNWNPNEGDQPSLHDIHQSEQFLDALASGRPIYANDAGEDELAYLMAGWRDSARNTPMRSTITEQDAVAALQRGLPRPQRGGAPRTGRRFSLTVVGSAAAAVLCLGGFGAIVAGAGPGDALYGLRTMLFGEVVRDDPVVLAAQTELAEVEQLIEQGDWDTAQQRLQAVTTTVATVGDEARKQELVAEWQELSVKVESRNPDATVPPDAPPVTLPVIPEVTDPATTTEPTEPGTSPTDPTEPGEPVEPGAPTEPGATPTDPTAPEGPPMDATEPGDGDDADTAGPTPTTSPAAEPTTSPESPPATTTVSPPATTGTATSAPATTPVTTPATPTTTTPAPATTTGAVTSATREPAAGGRAEAPATPAAPEPTTEAPVIEEDVVEEAPAAPATTTSAVLPPPGGPEAE
ncbi:anti-sigma-D factor RsdA [Mycolicibacterium thermoresistibile]